MTDSEIVFFELLLTALTCFMLLVIELVRTRRKKVSTEKAVENLEMGCIAFGLLIPPLFFCLFVFSIIPMFVSHNFLGAAFFGWFACLFLAKGISSFGKSRLKKWGEGTKA
ncbi:MAG: hypothetical protein LBI16_05460 [Burkholderiales bacterium]|jgi:hypothetical protein|nr:hypothetical protein [Burkholderiales bacterium]